ncbi:MAG: hypothetical protein KC418_18325 [Anaerolineales bacterium]|nr:hypothetical protein [Anaerolineales bacterium]MCB8952093.1 hypothetical protein [Ardenticatenales bacterium]
MQRIRTFPPLILIFVGWMLAGCAGISTSIATPVINQTPTGTPILRFQQSGGIVALNDEWAIYADGLITLNGSPNQQIAPTRVLALRDQLLGYGFNDLDATYLPADPCCDRFTYTLTLYQDGQSHSITTIDGTEGVPAELWQSIQAVLDLLSGAGTPAP